MFACWHILSDRYMLIIWAKSSVSGHLYLMTDGWLEQMANLLLATVVPEVYHKLVSDEEIESEDEMKSDSDIFPIVCWCYSFLLTFFFISSLSHRNWYAGVCFHLALPLEQLQIMLLFVRDTLKTVWTVVGEEGGIAFADDGVIVGDPAGVDWGVLCQDPAALIYFATSFYFSNKFWSGFLRCQFFYMYLKCITTHQAVQK